MKKLKERLSAKLSKNGGFTLIEMLIVVAIIAILVVVSIPLVTTSLDKAKEATDDANLRSAKAAAIIDYFDDQAITGKYYDLENGKMTVTAQTAQGQSTANQSSHIEVEYDSTADEFTAKWVND